MYTSIIDIYIYLFIYLFITIIILTIMIIIHIYIYICVCIFYCILNICTYEWTTFAYVCSECFGTLECAQYAAVFFPHSCADKIRCEPAGGPATSGKRMLFGGLNPSQKMWPFERLSVEEKNRPNDKYITLYNRILI